MATQKWISKPLSKSGCCAQLRPKQATFQSASRQLSRRQPATLEGFQVGVSLSGSSCFPRLPVFDSSQKIDGIKPIRWTVDHGAAPLLKNLLWPAACRRKKTFKFLFTRFVVAGFGGYEAITNPTSHSSVTIKDLFRNALSSTRDLQKKAATLNKSRKEQGTAAVKKMNKRHCSCRGSVARLTCAKCTFIHNSLHGTKIVEHKTTKRHCYSSWEYPLI